MIKLNAKQLRTTPADPEAAKSFPRNEVFIILDNVLDTYNVGSIFRLADAVAAKKIYLCGETLTPPNTRIKKASINTWGWVEWKYLPLATNAISEIRSTFPSAQVIAVEQDKRSRPFQTVSYKLPVAIIVGNETYGVSREALDESDLIVELPMWGINKSLNVMVSCGIVLYEIMRSNTAF